MITPSRLNRGSSLAVAIALIAFAVGFRLLRATLLPGLPNFSPVMALAVCGAFVLPGGLALLVPLAALIGSDMLLNLHYGVALLSQASWISYACYTLGVISGLGLRRLHAGAPLTLGTVAGNSLLFYFVTNSVCWLDNPVYAKTLAGWIQSLTIGVPGFPPTWMFLGYSLASDLLFAGAFLAAVHLAARDPKFESSTVRA